MIYVASKTKYAGMWRDLRDAEGWGIISTWIDEAEPGQTKNLRELWGRIQNEIERSDALVLYVELIDFPLKGALIEVGIALRSGLPVFVVGGSRLGFKVTPETLQRALGSWILHPQVTILDKLEDLSDGFIYRAWQASADSEG